MTSDRIYPDCPHDTAIIIVVTYVDDNLVFTNCQTMRQQFAAHCNKRVRFNDKGPARWYLGTQYDRDPTTGRRRTPRRRRSRGGRHHHLMDVTANSLRPPDSPGTMVVPALSASVPGIRVGWRRFEGPCPGCRFPPPGPVTGEKGRTWLGYWTPGAQGAGVGPPEPPRHKEGRRERSYNPLRRYSSSSLSAQACKRIGFHSNTTHYPLLGLHRCRCSL